MNKKVRIIIGMIGSLMLYGLGVYSLITQNPISSLTFLPIIFAVSGFIGVVASIVGLRKMRES